MLLSGETGKEEVLRKLRTQILSIESHLETTEAVVGSSEDIQRLRKKLEALVDEYKRLAHPG